MSDSYLSDFSGPFFGFFLIAAFAIWFLQGFAFYKMGLKARVPAPWLSFIPIANLFPYMAMIKRSAWNILWLFVPIAN
ncbi:MAG TPA: hypothetical protein VJ824_03570, partial [Bacillota bacterium]|nr:hypothetical protein [Bacillota bacterium]